MKFEYTNINYSPTDKEIIDDMKRVASENNLPKLTIKAYDEYGKYSSSTASRRFGTWNEALKKAKIEASQCFWRDEQLFENLREVWIKKAKQPSRRDMDVEGLSHISSGAYTRRFGKWSNAVKAFVEYMDQDDNAQFEKNVTISSEGSIIHRTKRDVNLRLRFKVLKRDCFRCCACGASPAKDPSVELEVDHIFPWEKGGETIEENLQTLCKKCNEGKTNIV